MILQLRRLIVFSTLCLKAGAGWGDVGTQGKCSLPCFLFLMYASAETLTNSRKKARISDSGSTHYLLNSRTISPVVLSTRRSNNCVYLPELLLLP